MRSHLSSARGCGFTCLILWFFLGYTIQQEIETTTVTSLGETTTEIFINETDLIDLNSDDDLTINIDPFNKFDYGKVVVARNGMDDYTEVEWQIPNFQKLLSEQVWMIRSRPFFTNELGYRVQLLMILNNTYADGSNYVGLFFRLMTSKFDNNLEWPYQLETKLTLVDQLDAEENLIHTVTPNTDPCRLRSLFLRPSQDKDWTLKPDGCGNRRHLSLSKITSEPTRYLNNGTMVAKALFKLAYRGKTHDVANVSLKYNNLITNYVWPIKNFTFYKNQSLANGSIEVLQSPQFYTHQGGYLMRLFLTILPKDKVFAISLALVQGDYDRYLQWPFPYSLEVAIVDHSPEYWRKDYTISLHPSSSDCTSSPFFQPSHFLDFCFITIQSLHLLDLTHYKFIVNGSLDLRLTTKFNHFSNRKMASFGMHNGHHVAEYSWLLPDLEYKLTRFDYSRRMLKVFTSPEFYTNGQGYLMQMILKLNSTDRHNGVMGLEMSILEGEYDGVLRWPFNHTFELLMSNHQANEDHELENYNRTQITTSARENEMYIKIVPGAKDNHCSSRCFTKPIERNPACGKKNLLSFKRVNRSNDIVKLGSLLVKARIFL